MRFSNTSRVTLVIALLALATSQFSSADINPEKWIEVQSENFTMLTDLSPEKARRQILDLELFRSVVLKVTGVSDKSRVVPMKLYVFKHLRDFKLMAPGGSAYGYFLPSLRQNQMVFPARVNRFGKNVIMYHEFVHALLHDGENLYPRWYDEGLADMLSTMRISGDKVIISGNNPARSRRLRADDIYVPIAEILNNDDAWGVHRILTSYMYSMAWATMNFLYTGHLYGYPEYASKLPAYVDALSLGIDRDTAFRQAFGISPLGIEKQVRSFLQVRRRNRFSFPLEEFPIRQSVTYQAVAPRDALFELGYLMLVQNPARARGLFDKILNTHKNDMRARVGKAVTYQMEGDWDAALHLAGNTVRSAARNQAGHNELVHLEYADMLRSFCQSEQAPADCTGKYKLAKGHYQAVLQFSPQHREARLGLGIVLAALNQDLQIAREHMQSAYDLVAYSANVNYWLGHLHHQLNEPEQAKPYLLRALNRSHSTFLTNKTREVLVAIDPAFASNP